MRWHHHPDSGTITIGTWVIVSLLYMATPFSLTLVLIATSATLYHLTLALMAASATLYGLTLALIAASATPGGTSISPMASVRWYSWSKSPGVAWNLTYWELRVAPVKWDTRRSPFCEQRGKGVMNRSLTSQIMTSLVEAQTINDTKTLRQRVWMQQIWSDLGVMDRGTSLSVNKLINIYIDFWYRFTPWKCFQMKYYVV